MDNTFNLDIEIDQHIDVVRESIDSFKINIPKISKLIISTFESGGKVYTFGNGGSAADSIHFSAELTGKFRKMERKPLPCISLSENISTLTAIGNDFNFSEIFSRQIDAFGKKGDLVIGITTSGRSSNILEAFKKAKQLNLNTICLTGDMKGLKIDNADITFEVKSSDTARIQESHILFIHLICDLIDKHFTA